MRGEGEVTVAIVDCFVLIAGRDRYLNAKSFGGGRVILGNERSDVVHHGWIDLPPRSRVRTPRSTVPPSHALSILSLSLGNGKKTGEKKLFSNLRKERVNARVFFDFSLSFQAKKASISL